MLASSLWACQGEGVLIDVSVAGRTSEVSQLLVTAEHDGQAALGAGEPVTRTPDHFLVRIPDTLRGELRIHVSGLGASGCQIASGAGSASIAGPGRYAMEIMLNPQAGCVLEVERVGRGSGRVISVPAGIDCGERCSAAFTLAREVRLVAQTGDYFGGWFADASATGCAGRDPAGCIVPIESGVLRVRTNFLLDPGCTSAQWCDEEDLPPITADLRAAWGSGPRDVWAVGDGGLVARSDGIAWRKIDVPDTGSDLKAVWGSGPRDVWAVGTAGTVLHWDGKSIAGLPRATTRDLFGVWGSGRAEVLAVGDGGVLLWRRGDSWERVVMAAGRRLNAIWGTGPGNVWVVGEHGTVLRRDGTAWGPVASGTTAALHAVWGSGPDLFWVAGESGTLLEWKDNQLRSRSAFTTAGLHALWGNEANDAWAVGEGGTVLRWNGTVWSALRETERATDRPLFGIWGSGPSDAWAVGQGFTIIRYRR